VGLEGELLVYDGGEVVGDLLGLFAVGCFDYYVDEWFGVGGVEQHVVGVVEFGFCFGDCSGEYEVFVGACFVDVGDVYEYLG